MMNLSTLTSENLIMLDAVFENRIDAITQMTQKLADAGKLSDQKTFFDAVMKREEEGPTALGEGLAVPHGKSDAVKEPVFACAFVKDELQWVGLDGDEPVQMIFLLAIPPAEAGSTHMAVLTELTSSLVDDEFREGLLAAKSSQEVMKLLGDDSAEEPEVLEMVAQPQESNRAYPMVLLTGCAIIGILFAMM